MALRYEHPLLRAMREEAYQRVRAMKEGKIPARFPYIDDGRRLCISCKGPGWGPMLVTDTWAEIMEFYMLHSEREVLLCQRCMEVILKRPLTTYDIRDCPMNGLHPLYQPHGRM